VSFGPHPLREAAKAPLAVPRSINKSSSSSKHISTPSKPDELLHQVLAHLLGRRNALLDTTLMMIASYVSSLHCKVLKARYVHRSLERK